MVLVNATTICPAIASRFPAAIDASDDPIGINVPSSPRLGPTRTIIGLATGTVAYVVAAVRHNWVNETVRDERFLAERVAVELEGHELLANAPAGVSDVDADLQVGIKGE